MNMKEPVFLFSNNYFLQFIHAFGIFDGQSSQRNYQFKTFMKLFKTFYIKIFCNINMQTNEESKCSHS